MTVTRLDETRTDILPRPAPPREGLGRQQRALEKRANMAESSDQKDEVEAQVELEEKGEEKEQHLELQPEQETMRSVVLTGYGGYNKLEVQKYAKPKPMNGQVVVCVHAWWVQLLSFVTTVFTCFCW